MYFVGCSSGSVAVIVMSVVIVNQRSPCDCDGGGSEAITLVVMVVVVEWWWGQPRW